MICRRDLSCFIKRRFYCRHGLSSKMFMSSVTNQLSSSSPILSSSHFETKLFPDTTSKIVLKPDCTDVDAVLEKMKYKDDDALTQELIDALKQVASHTLDERKRELKAVDIATFNKLEEAHKSALFLRQLYAEEEQQSDAVSDYNEALKNLITVGRGTGLKYIQRVLLKWYEPLTRVLDAEVSLIEQRVVGQDRTQYGPCLLLLPAEKLAVITLDECLNSILKVGNGGVQLTSLSRRIGDVIEAEVAIIKLQKGKSGLRPWQHEELKKMYRDSNFRRTRQKLNQLVDEDVWSSDTKVKVGAALISFLLDSAKTDRDTPAFQYAKKLFQKGTFKRVGILLLENAQYLEISGRDTNNVAPRHLPMLVPPKQWDNRDQREGCYYRIRSSIMRTNSKSQTDALKRADMSDVLCGLDYLGQIGWRINKPIYDVIKACYERKLVIGDLPGKEVVPPTKEECIRIVPKTFYKTIFKMKSMIEDADIPHLNEDEHTWVEEKEKEIVMESKEKIEIQPEKEKENPDIVEKPSKKKKKKYPPVEDHDPSIPRFDEKYYNDLCRRTAAKNAALHSIRCDLQLKFWVAEKFKDDTFYFPYNLDFRGRAYPVPPNLNHLGSDLCRALLVFDEVKALGDSGLFWMKVHLSNLFGNNKVSHDDRVAFVESHMQKILESVESPLEGEMWWSTAEEPFQALATMIEIVSAVKSGDPSTYMCRLPIHQDGSCNGLQHYAALGRDSVGAAAVNVRPSVKPQDVYTSVLDIVRMKIAVDVTIPPDSKDELDRARGENARLVKDVVDRRVIKQTVMTSVYGVTKVGARAQIHARLAEKLLTDATILSTIEMDKALFGASTYLANLTLESLQEMFTSAKDIMDWLGTCASLVASQGQAMTWVTPLGLPVLQPYRKSSTHTVRTILQSITLSLDDDALPVSKQKQRTAFPPNFVHSLDATHMLMTAIRMKDKNITFAAVHDSYWTHAQDIPAMNVAIRDCFFDLYNEPILETLKESLSLRYPDVNFPPVPMRGNLDLKSVKQSTYFFH